MSHPRFCPKCGHDFYPPTPIWWCQRCVNESATRLGVDGMIGDNAAAIMQGAFKLHGTGFCVPSPDSAVSEPAPAPSQGDE